MELPPGDTKCLVYVNGPAVAIGVLSASGFAGVTSGLGIMMTHVTFIAC